jgi:hypothetical protein
VYDKGGILQGRFFPGFTADQYISAAQLVLATGPERLLKITWNITDTTDDVTDDM